MEISKYVDSINYLNQLICESRPSEMKQLESVSVDEYYQTINTWIRIIDERNKAMENATKGRDADVHSSIQNNEPKEPKPGQTRRKFTPK